MGKLTHSELIVLLLSMAIMLIVSRIFAEFGRKFKLPVVMGEIVVGILLGPTLFGKLAPDQFEYIFPMQASGVSIALDGIVKISVIMMLFVAGLEVQLALVFKQGRAAITTSLMSMAFPFIVGFGAAWYFPGFFNESKGLLFSLFLGTAMAISALPVIARILIDMNIFKTRIGMIIMASAIFNDLVGWLIFSMILSILNDGHAHAGILYTFAYIMAFGLFMLTVGRMVINRTLPWIQNKLSWPGGVLSISLGICFLSGAFTEYIGLHAILGAFIAGIAFGDSVHLHEKAREIIHQFVTNIFAPLFFVSIGLKVDFISNFDASIVLFVLVIAYVGKVVGAGLGAYWGGLNRNESLAIGFGMNARGAMEIILGTLALDAGLIKANLFVALVIMALLTSLTSAPFMRYFLDKDFKAQKV